MHIARKIAAVVIAALFSMGMMNARPGYGITVKEEEDLSRQILHVIYKQFEIIEDPVVVEYVNRVGNRILSHLPPQPFRYRFHVIRQEVYNAFAIPAGHIFVYSGLIDAMEEEEELAGILGHEIAHVYCRHISQKIERSKKIGVATLAGIAAGVLLGIGGMGEVGQAVTTGSMAAAQSTELAYTRENELQADQFGLKFITEAGYSAEGLLKILKKIRSKQWFGSEQVPTYLMTHPAVEARIAYISSWLENYNRTHRPLPLVNEDNFRRVHTRLLTQFGNEQVVLQKLKGEVARNPEDPMAHYRYGLILARIGKRGEALEQLRTALTKRAFDPYILKDMGRIYFFDGQYPEALKTLESACEMIPKDLECRFYLGRVRMETGDLDSAVDIFSELIDSYPGYTPAYYFLGDALGKQGNKGEAHYYLGLYYVRKRDLKNAGIQLKMAVKYMAEGEKRRKAKKLLARINAALSGKTAKSGG